jgi:hypothetical protein
MSLDTLPFNAFDLLLVVLLILGIYRGRKHGMSEELLPLIKWLLIPFVCAVLYEPVAGFFLGTSAMFSRLACYIMAYSGAGIVILLCFAGIKHSLGGKIIGSDIFGSAEYYLGMGSGLIRFACMTMAALALLNAWYFSPKEVQAMEKFQNDVYGSNFFPGLHSLQATVFERSLTGSWIKENLSFLLIKPTAPEDTQIHQREYKF